jgi:hypothetical protein
MRTGLLLVAAVAERPMVASSFAGGRCAATIEATGTRLVQSHGVAIEGTFVVVPRTTTFFGSGFTTDAFPSIVSVLLA